MEMAMVLSGILLPRGKQGCLVVEVCVQQTLVSDMWPKRAMVG